MKTNTLAAFIIVLMFLSGCSVFMAAKQPEKKNIERQREIAKENVDLFTECTIKYADSLIKSKESATDIADASLSICESYKTIADSAYRTIILSPLIPGSQTYLHMMEMAEHDIRSQNEKIKRAIIYRVIKIRNQLNK